MNWKVLLVLNAVVTVYLLLGGVAFHFLERRQEQQLDAGVKEAVADFLSSNPCVNASSLMSVAQQLADAYSAGYRLGSNGSVSSPPPRWDFHSSVFFCITVVTTIGYGHLAPSTPGGRILFSAYALCGIPLLATALSGLADRMNRIRRRLRDCGPWRGRRRAAEAASSVLYLCIGSCLFVFAPAAVFCVLEDWHYSEACYYALATLSTVGFGDYVAGQRLNSALYKILLLLWIFLGLVFISGLISGVQEVMEKGVGTVDAEVTNLEAKLDAGAEKAQTSADNEDNSADSADTSGDTFGTRAEAEDTSAAISARGSEQELRVEQLA